MTSNIKVTSPTTLSNSFIGNVVQICVVTPDLYLTLANFVKLGIGPWRIYTFDTDNVIDQTYKGKPEAYSLKLATGWSDSTFWEVIQPLEGNSSYKDWLEKHGEGIQHVAVTCGNMSYGESVDEFQNRGYSVIQSGNYQGKVPFAYLNTEHSIGVTVELMDLPEGFVMPAPDKWYPGPPPDS